MNGAKCLLFILLQLEHKDITNLERLHLLFCYQVIQFCRRSVRQFEVTVLNSIAFKLY